MMDYKIKIVIADDHQLFRQGLVSLFDDIDDIEVVAQATDGDELIQKYLTLKPNMVIADVSMPNLSGFEALKQIQRVDPNARFFFLTMFDSPEYIHYTRKIGGRGLIGKNAEKNELGHGIREIMNGREYFGKEWPAEKLEELEKQYHNLADGVIDPNIVLTYREKKILYYISEGYTSNEIADKLEVTKRTVDTHRYNLMKKVKANSLSQLIAYAIKFTTLNKNQSEEKPN